MNWVKWDIRTRGQSGAAAVEFALISVIFFPMLFGMIQYGLWFNDALNARQGVREAVRQGVVRNFDGGTGANDMAKLKDITTQEIGALTGATYVKVKPPTPWSKGSPLTICAAIRSDGGIGLLPTPNGGWIVTKTQMSIEQDADPLPTGGTESDTPPGFTWSGWCD